MSFDVDRLYTLLPAIYRLRDEEQGKPLRALLAVIAEQIAVLEDDLAQLYDNYFIETCADWVAPYIGDLLGTRNLFVFPGADFNSRAQVANTLAYRRRKGTAAILEQLARDVTGWPACVVEYFQRLATTQYLNHLRPDHLTIASVRTEETYRDTPFDPLPRTVDVRNIASGRGQYNLPNIGIFLWRLRSYPVTDVVASKVDDRRYRFDPFGRDLPLFSRPEPEEEITHLAEPVNVPMPLSRRVLERNLSAYYGKDKSLLLTTGLPPVTQGADRIQVCDLSDLKDKDGKVINWANLPQNKIAIDPVLGRIAFPANQPPPSQVRVSYHYGFSADLGCNNYGTIETKDLSISQNRSALFLNGGSLIIKGGLPPDNRLELHHCTLRPSVGKPAISIEIPNVTVVIDHCIVLGAIHSIDSSYCHITDSIVDAGVETAYAGPAGINPGAPLTVKNSTLIGSVNTALLELATNTIFLSPPTAQRLQQGCARFSYLPPGSQVPRQYHCQPQSQADAARLRPVFTSLRFGDPDYCQLSPHCAIEIRQGADDQAEMGAFHHLYQPQREANLRESLQEFLRFGLEAGIFYAS
ncbi:MAG: hypothetical protein U1F76_29410 [Candidatus Competibacteraceae bacterium]